MPHINLAIIAGHLGRDPEEKHLPSGDIVVNFSVATTEKYKDKETTTWHNMVAFGKTAELISRFLRKGSAAMFEGRIQVRQWEDKEGNKRTNTEIVVNRMHFLGGGKKEEDGSAGLGTKKPSGASGFADLQDDIPW